MSNSVTGRRRPTKPKKQARTQKRKREDVDVEKLQQAIHNLNDNAVLTKFTDLPLSEATKAGLKACHFSTLTDIQARAIVKGLKGSDILGAAKTGSGKTLAFLVPVLENLYREQCVGADAGLGAMIVSPTRELAIQIFEVLRKVGGHGHIFAAGLIIGGKSLREEQDALAKMNIVVCTPGRMLQHLSQTADFNVDNLRMLVLDEADRIMDMGFQRDVDAIVEYLPSDRQTLLFSATQTKRVSDLARLSLKDPEYVSVHESAASATPQNLQQTYVVAPLPAKLDTLWSFLQTAKKSKLLVFLSSGKQVRFVYESFRRLQPGIPLLHLHGRQKQTARLEITSRFRRATHACLFATDVAARGLDFPAVDWVVQVDCPEDADTYIHRVGRTARYERAGQAVLFLDPSEEEGMLARLAAKKVPIERIHVRQKKQRSVRDQLQGMCFKDPELKYLGQKAFISYVRSVHVQSDKQVFDLSRYALEEFAASMGLPGAPRIKFMKGDAEAVKAAKNASRRQASASSSEAEVEDDDRNDVGASSKEKDKTDKPRTKYDRMFTRTNQSILTPHYSRLVDDDDLSFTATSAAAPTDNGSMSKEQEDDLFTVKSRHVPSTSQPSTTQPAKSNRQRKAALTHAGAAKLALHAADPTQRLAPRRLVFDDDTGDAKPPAPPFRQDVDDGIAGFHRAEETATYRAREAERLRLADDEDADMARARRRAKKLRRKERERGDGDGEASTGAEGGGARGGAALLHQDGGAGAFEELADLFPSPASSGGEEDGGRSGAGTAGTAKRAGNRSVKRGAERGAGDEELEDMEALARGLLG